MLMIIILLHQFILGQVQVLKDYGVMKMLLIQMMQLIDYLFKDAV
jgi:hypothetical protein